MYRCLPDDGGILATSGWTSRESASYKRARGTSSLALLSRRFESRVSVFSNASYSSATLVWIIRISSIASSAKGSDLSADLRGKNHRRVLARNPVNNKLRQIIEAKEEARSVSRSRKIDESLVPRTQNPLDLAKGARKCATSTKWDPD